MSTFATPSPALSTPPTRVHQVAVLNRCSVASDEEIERITRALQRQVAEDFASSWGITADLTFLSTGQKTGWEGKWNLVVLDDSDTANALGYHDLTPDGLPLGKCFARTDQIAGNKLSVTMSHELLEMLGDPLINLQAMSDDGTIYAYENCDAVEADALGYDIDGVTVSDFVTPAWFCSQLGSVAGVEFDHGGHVQHPFELAPGGYISVLRLGEGWTQIFARALPGQTTQPDPLARPRVGSRRERRRTPRDIWTRSVK